MLQALAHRAGGDAAAASAALSRALTLAEPEGYVRVFVDEGAPMTALLDAAAQEARPAYVRRLLAAFAGGRRRSTRHAGAGRPAERARARRAAAARRPTWTGPGIARELVVSLNTVRTHTKNIYAKLGVNSRRAAVRRAAELELLARDRDALTAERASLGRREESPPQSPHVVMPAHHLRS